jgi:hypothetical protein
MHTAYYTVHRGGSTCTVSLVSRQLTACKDRAAIKEANAPRPTIYCLTRTLVPRVRVHRLHVSRTCSHCLTRILILLSVVSHALLFHECVCADCTLTRTVVLCSTFYCLTRTLVPRVRVRRLHDFRVSFLFPLVFWSSCFLIPRQSSHTHNKRPPTSHALLSHECVCVDCTFPVFPLSYSFSTFYFLSSRTHSCSTSACA